MTSPSDPPFHSIAIAGLGLIGGSIALAVRERWPSVRVLGVDTPAVLAHATGSGAIDRAVDRLADLPAVDLLILAAPVRQNIELLREAATGGSAGVITDVGGTKRDIVETACTLSNSQTFIGGHPLAGAERGGFAFARPDLFTGRPWIFTPTDDRRADIHQRLTRFAAGLGALPATMTAAAHDRLMAFVSHLPQLAASALMDAVGQAVGAEGLALAGPGLADTTRLASSPAALWRDICATNGDDIGLALDQLIATLTHLRADLAEGAVVEQVFDGAARWRRELTKDRPK